ncbi:RnfABCDGE type electron transport complex subunit B [Castellaniella sp.]|uniref:RnfABCDGE type electron transport complex subunit B n=1 Tax=Castellaniella sp. TaxID=1955812 RepID=UPI002AFFD278|nr:RnfABCDGE type electron transport complex subunit B [Castellaniella sp.]
MKPTPPPSAAITGFSPAAGGVRGSILKSPLSSALTHKSSPSRTALPQTAGHAHCAALFYTGRAMSSLIDTLDALLPQTQCGQCGFDGCRPYAQAMADGQAEINRCPPGGPQTIATLAQALGRPILPLDPDCGTHQPFRVALIDEEHCIGCTLCIQACPVDAILGANQSMHTVIEDDCTGCERCVAPCPVDCISMVPAGRDWTIQDADTARVRYMARNERLQARHAEADSPAARTLANKPTLVAPTSDHDKQDRIAQALARARARRP